MAAAFQVVGFAGRQLARCRGVCGAAALQGNVKCEGFGVQNRVQCKQRMTISFKRILESRTLHIHMLDFYSFTEHVDTHHRALIASTALKDSGNTSIVLGSAEALQHHNLRRIISTNI